MFAIRRFILNAIFPTVPSLNLAVFLFLILAVIFSYAEPAFLYIQSPEFYRDSINGVPVPRFATLLWVIGSLSLCVVVLGSMCVAVTALLLGKWDPEASVHPGQSLGSLRGLSLILYALAATGSYFSMIGGEDAGFAFTIFSAYAALFGGLGVLFLMWFPATYLPEVKEPKPYSDAEVLVSTCIAGGAFLYYGSILSLHPFEALCSAYVIFATLAGLYRSVVGIFAPHTPPPTAQ